MSESDLGSFIGQLSHYSQLHPLWAHRLVGVIGIQCHQPFPFGSQGLHSASIRNPQLWELYLTVEPHVLPADPTMLQAGLFHQLTTQLFSSAIIVMKVQTRFDPTLPGHSNFVRQFCSIQSLFAKYLLVNRTAESSGKWLQAHSKQPTTSNGWLTIQSFKTRQQKGVF